MWPSKCIWLAFSKTRVVLHPYFPAVQVDNPVTLAVILALAHHPIPDAVVTILVLFFGAYVFNLCECLPVHSAILYVYPFFLYFGLRNPSRKLKDSLKITMSGTGGYFKYRCKYWLTYNCPNWVWVNNAPCAHCLVRPFCRVSKKDADIN